MSRKVCIASLVALGALALLTRAGPPQTRPAAPAVKITINEFTDDRALVRVPLSEKIHMLGTPGIFMELKLEGDAIRNASRIAEPQITEAVDDLGNSLLSS